MKQDRIQSFWEAASVLPPRIQAAVQTVPDEEKAVCEEIRMRAGQPLSLARAGRENPIVGTNMDTESMQETVSRAARYSVHSFHEALAQGYLPLLGGHRLGVCGTAVVKEGRIAGIRTVCALNLRIARAAPGSADAVLSAVIGENAVRSTLIFSPPGFGKTTLLRDLIRQLSGQGVRVAIADERGELAGVRDGVPQFDVGPVTDVMDGCPKAQGAMILLKTMAPAVIALDEVTAPEDVAAVAFAGHCGVSVIATAHAWDRKDLMRRPLSRQLLELGVFERGIQIVRQANDRRYEVLKFGRDMHA